MANRAQFNQSVAFSKVAGMQGNGSLWYTKDEHLLTNIGDPNVVESNREKNGWHAGYYVIIVILVYGMSIVMLIASHINRKHQKILEDRQIHKYLKEFQVVKERSSRDSYRNLKKAIIAKLYRGAGGDRSSNSSAGVGGKSGGIYRCMSRSVLPVTTLVFPSAMSAISDELAMPYTVSNSREALAKDKSGTDACLCNLYVIEEFDGERRASRAARAIAHQAGTLSSFDDDMSFTSSVSRRPRGAVSAAASRRLRSKYYQPPGSRRYVTAEINIPPSSMSVCSEPSAAAASYNSTGSQDQSDTNMDLCEVSVDVRGPYDTELSDLTDYSRGLGHDRSCRQGERFVSRFGESFLPNRPSATVAPVHLPTPKRRSPLLHIRTSHGASENVGFVSTGAHHADDSIHKSPYSTMGRHVVNPLQISSV